MPKSVKPAAIDHTEVEAAEAAAQRSVVTFPDGKVPDDLAKALARRVEVSLEHAETTGEVARVGGSDPQVRDLEAPYSKRVRRDAEDPAPKKPRGGHRQPAKKAAAKKTAAKKTAATSAPTTTEGSD